MRPPISVRSISEGSSVIEASLRLVEPDAGAVYSVKDFDRVVEDADETGEFVGLVGGERARGGRGGA